MRLCAFLLMLFLACQLFGAAGVVMAQPDDAAWEIVCVSPDEGVGLNLQGPESGCQPITSYIPPPPSVLPP